MSYICLKVNTCISTYCNTESKHAPHSERWYFLTWDLRSFGISSDRLTLEDGAYRLSRKAGRKLLFYWRRRSHNVAEASVHSFICLFLSRSNTHVLSYTLSWRRNSSVTQTRELMGGKWRSECAGNERQQRYLKHTARSKRGIVLTVFFRSLLHAFSFSEVQNCYCYMLTLEICSCVCGN